MNMRQTETSPNAGEALFGVWLKRRRKSLGLTQKALAARADYSVAMLRKIEADDRRPSLELASRLAELLDVAVEERAAFLEFARGGWSDLPPPAYVPNLDRPWLPHSRTPSTSSGPATERDVIPAQPVLVAREAELKRLESYLERAMTGQTQVVLVRGEVGQGKTALLEAFAYSAKEAHPELLLASGSCNAYTGPGDPYLPFREIIQLLVGNGTSIAAVAEVAPDLIGTFLPEHTGLNILASKGIAGGAHAHSASASGPGKAGSKVPLRSDALMDQYLQLITRMAQDRPLLLLLDDLHWVDTASADLLLHLTRHLTGRSVLLVGSYRGEEVAHGRGDARHPFAAVVNELRRQQGDVVLDLDRDADREFLDGWLDQEPNRLGEGFRDSLYQQTAGHPLFTIELVRAMQERGDLSRDVDGHWVAPPEIIWASLPARVEGVIDERVGRIAPDLMQWLKVAAVEGEEFTAEVIAHVLDIPMREIARGLSTELSGTHRLIAAHKLQHLHGVGVALGRYRFRHNLIQRRLYEALDTVERAYHHEAVAEALSVLHADRIDEVAIQLAHHFLSAGASGRAARHLRQAGRNAQRAGALNEAIRYYHEALEHWPDSVSHAPEDMTAIRFDLGECQWLGGHLLEAQATLARAYEGYEEIGDVEGAAAVQRRIGRIFWELGMRPMALEHYQKSLNIVRDRPENRELAYTLSSVSQMHMLASECDLAVAVGERAIEIARRIDAKEVVAHALNNIGSALMDGWPGQFETGRAKLLESRRLSLELGLAHDACRAMFNLAENLRAYGRTKESRELLLELLPYATRLGIKPFVRSGQFELFDLERRCGNWRECFTNSGWTEQSDPEPEIDAYGSTLARIYFASARTDLGDPGSALVLLDQCGFAVGDRLELQIALPYLGERIRALAALGDTKGVEQEIGQLLHTLAAVPFTKYSAHRGLLAACQWLGVGRPDGQPGQSLEKCVSELQRLERQYESPNVAAAVREGEGWLALAAGRLTDAAANFEDAEGLWLGAGFPLDRLRALDGSRNALLRKGSTAEGQLVTENGDQILLTLMAQLEDPELAKSMAGVRQGWLAGGI